MEKNEDEEIRELTAIANRAIDENAAIFKRLSDI